MRRDSSVQGEGGGFTLIELLIVVVIIGILASIAIPKFRSTQERAYLAAMKSDLKNLAHLQEVYHNENYTFTTSLTDLAATTTEGVTVTINEGTTNGWAATAVHQALTGEQCGIYHGASAAGGGSPASVPSVVECTR